jgi:predicted transcriptional regulator of viral defense system
LDDMPTFGFREDSGVLGRRETYRDALWDVALGQRGYVTTTDAHEVGVPPVELRKLAARGSLIHISRGLYSFVGFPVTAQDHYLEAVLWAGPDAALSHDAVLAFHDLAFANPSTIRVTTPHRVRKSQQRSDITIVQADVPANQLTHYDGIPATTVARALLDARPLIMRSRLVEAADQARERGLLLSDEYQAVMDLLRGSA